MGKKHHRKGKGRDANVWEQDRTGATTSASSGDPLSNAKFEAYYKAQGIISSNEDGDGGKDEWPAFLTALRKPLPTSFRIAGSRETAELLNNIIKHTHVDHLQTIVHDGEAVGPPTQLSWYPDGLAWQFSVPKAVLRKQAAFRKFQSFLVYETEVGNISRQESVSMIPPLLLDVQPHHRVLDMCAAPGSKTAQLLEALHSLDPTGGSPPPGLLIANDADTKRAHLLIHQSARLPSPAFMVTNLDAAHYPALTIPVDIGLGTSNDDKDKDKIQDPDTVHHGVPDIAGRREPLLFDRILCDVPCSGDGTMRKNPGIWTKWTPQDGNGLHALQLRILTRALRLLKPGGRLVYSTCSLNPIENEAVVAGALSSSLNPINSDITLIDPSDRLPGLIRRLGMKTWIPSTGEKGKEVQCDADEDYEKYKERMGENARLAESHFPPSKEEADKMGLERCMRIYPHDQDTGGFFVAVLEKAALPAGKAVTSAAAVPAVKRAAEDEVKDEPEGKRVKLDDTLAAMDEDGAEIAPVEETTSTDAIDDEAIDADASATPATTSAPTASKPPRTKNADTGIGGGGGGDNSYKEAPFTFLAPTDPNVTACLTQLALTPSFPRSHVYARASPNEPVRALYLTTPLLHALMAVTPSRRLRLLSAGARVFVRQGQGDISRFRVLAEGLPVVRNWVKPEDVITADLKTLRALMEAYYPLCAAFAQPFRKEVEGRGQGSHIVRFRPEESAGSGGGSLPHELLLPIWKSNVSVSLMLDKKAKSALSMRVFGEDVTLAAQATQKAKADAKASAVDGTEATGDAVMDVAVDDTVPDAVVDTAAATVAEDDAAKTDG